MTAGKDKGIRRIFPLLLSCIFLTAALSGCQARIHGADNGTVGTKGEGLEEDSRLSVVTTIFPYYDFIRQVGGDRISLSMVVPAGMDSHSFEPTPADMKLIQDADMFICNGGAMEHWVEQVVDALEDPELKVITMMDYVDVVEEEIVEAYRAAPDVLQKAV